MTIRQSSRTISFISSICAILVAWFFFKTFEDPIGLQGVGFIGMMTGFVHSANLIIHEAGHTIFFFTPQLFMVAAGSLFQIAVPLFFAIYFYTHNSIRSGSYVMMWVANNIADVAVYIGDAVHMNLPLLGGDGVIHDWNYILSEMNLLSYTNNIAAAAHTLAVIALIVSTSLILWSNWTGEKEGPNMNLGQ